MSRIQDILSKAERDGTVRRTRSLSDDFQPPRSSPLAPVASLAEERASSAAASAVAPAPPWPTAAAVPSAAAGASQGPRTFELERHLVAALAPASLAAEQYRSLRTRIKRAEGNRVIRAIAITSPAKGDGKSLTAANLALTMGEEYQQRVLLVDGDLRRPTIHHMFGFEDGLVPLPEYHITILPAGTPPSHPAEMLGSAPMRRVLDTLRTRFDRILIDMPPVAPLADVHIVAPMVDGLLMIVRAGITPKPAIERALAGLDMTKVLGLVLNASGGDISNKQAYEGYGYIGG
jgi:capsular exopolysaccharide synthesis family protein